MSFSFVRGGLVCLPLVLVGCLEGAVDSGALTFGVDNGNSNDNMGTPVAASIAFVEGGGQSVPAGETLPFDPIVRVLDDDGFPVEGVSVDFVVTAGGGSVSVASALSDFAGEVSTEWTLGVAAGQNSLTARSGLVEASITATGEAGDTAEIVAAAGVEGQSAIVGTTVAIAPSVTLTDESSDPRVGVTVRFDPSGDGVSAPSTAVTDASGVASISSWTLGTFAGAQTLTVSAEGRVLVVNATATPDEPAEIVVGAGVDGQSAVVDSAVAIPPSVSVLDQYGNPVPGTSVTFTVSGGGGAVAGSDQTSALDGTATAGSWTLGQSAGANELTVTAGAASATIDATGVSGAAASLEIGPGVAGQSALANAPVAVDPFVIVRDAFGNSVSDVLVTFAVTAGGGTIAALSDTSDEDGVARAGTWTLGGALGTNTLRASSAGVPDVEIDAEAADVTLAIVSGNRQTSSPGSPLANPIVVEALGGVEPQSGVSVDFTVVTGNGTVSSTTVVTGVDGRAQTTWTMGVTPGLTTLDASISSGDSVEFEAAGTDFNIQLEFEDGTNPTPTELEAFERAAFIWEATIINDLPDVSSTNCLSGGGINVDDLHIAVQFEPDDGAGGRLGQAGPCRIRGGTQSPAAGLMLLDSADVADLDASGLLDETILHEMGHVLGIGTLWARFGLLENRSTTSTPTNPCSGEVPGQDTRFVGVEAAAEFAALGGMGNTPAENDTDRYGCGSLDGHFREATFGTELMTPSLGSGAQLSRVTIASLSDLGFYTVSYGTADPYTLPTGGGLFRDPPRRLVCTLGVIEEIP